MILFLSGMMGLGKTTLAKNWYALNPSLRHHVEIDSLRDAIKRESPTIASAPLEDALNWRAFSEAVRKSREGKDICIDSSGASRRYAYLRYALGDYDQKLVRLVSSEPLARARAKWSGRISEGQLQFYSDTISKLRTDYDILIDNKNPQQVLQELENYLKVS